MFLPGMPREMFFQTTPEAAVALSLLRICPLLDAA
jgi:hypothetical protein